MIPKPVLTIDGAMIDDLEGFMREVARLLDPGVFWGRNLDAFNDVLRGGFGTPEGGFVLRWLNSERSRVALGMPETISWLERKLVTCHPSNVASVQADIRDAREGKGDTLFDILVEIIRTHGPGGEESEDGVILELQ